MIRFVVVLGVCLVLSACQNPTTGGQNVALLYGISDYGLPKGANNLTYPKPDVEALAPLLSSSNGGIFQVTARTDAAATRDAIEQDLRDAASVMDANSVFLFYYGGHGEQGQLSMGGVEGHAYILPRGSITSSSIVTSKVITEDDLESLLSTLPTKKIIVILDACFSGGFINPANGSDGVPQDSGAYYSAL